MARWFVDRSAQRGIPSVSLRRLLPDARFSGLSDLRVSGCSADSRRLDPGQVFVALRGRRHDGHDFVGLALERGAVAVIVERPCPEAGRLQVIVPNTRQALARLCQALAGFPSESIPLIGVSGASGKTGTSLFLRAILQKTDSRIGLVSSAGWSDGATWYPPRPTFPNPPELADMLAAMVERRCDAGLLAFADEALARREADGLTLAQAIGVRGDSQDLDERQRLESRRARSRLFRTIQPGGDAIVNADDPEIERLGAVNLEARRVSFGLDHPADVTAVIDQLDVSGSTFRLRGFDREATIRLKPLGRSAVLEATAAAAAAWSRGIALDAVVAGLESVSRLPGRLEPWVPDPESRIDCRIDQARTGRELADALSALRQSGFARIHCLLSIDGEPSHLSGLAQAAERGADQIVVSLDESFRGDPDPIVDTLLSHFRRPGRVRVELDRARAMEATLSLASPGDVVLLACQARPPLPVRIDRPSRLDDAAFPAPWLQRRPSRAHRRSA